MNLNLRLISAAAIAVCSMASHAATAPNPNAVNTAKCVKPTDPATAEDFVAHCAPAATIFIGGASTMKSNVLDVLKVALFDTTAMTPIEIVDEGSLKKANVKAYYGLSKTITNGYPAGSRILVVYNYNNGSAGGVSQLLAKTPALKDAADPIKGLPEANVVFVGPAKDVNTAGGTIKNLFCGTGVAGVATVSTATKVGCKSNSMQTADMALSDVRAEELYSMYPLAAATPAKFLGLAQVPLFVQSFGVAVSESLYKALQTKNGLASTCGDSGATNIDGAACQPSISRADYASLVSKGGKIKTLADLTGNTADTAPLVLARRDDLSGTQAVSNMFFVNGQCGGNNEQANTKSIDAAILKAGSLMGGLEIRTKGTSESTAALDVMSAATSDDVKTAVGGAGYAIGVLGVGSGGKQGTTGRFVKIDGFSPNYDGTNYMNSTATRNQINAGYPFSYVMIGMYSKAVMDAKTAVAKKATVTALLDGFKSSASAVNGGTNLSGIAYLDSAATLATAAQQSKYTRVTTGGVVNNCAPLTKL